MNIEQPPPACSSEGHGDQEKGHSKVGSAAPKKFKQPENEYDILIAQLQSLHSGQHLSQEQQVIHEQRLTIDQKLSQEQQLSIDQQLNQEHKLSHEQQLTMDRQPKQEQKLSQEQRLTMDRQPNQEQQVSQEQQLTMNRQPNQEQKLSQEKQLTMDRQPNQGQKMSQEQQLTMDRQPNQEQKLSQEKQLSMDRHPNKGQRLNNEPQLSLEQQLCQDQKLNHEQHLSQEQLLSQKHEMNQLPELFTKKDLRLPSMEELLRIMAQVEEIKTFDDAAIFFSLEEWNEWKEVEELLRSSVIEVHSDRQGLEDFGLAAKANTIEHLESGSDGISEISCIGILNNINEVKNPVKEGDKLLPDRILSIKERLKNIHRTDKKTTTVPSGTVEKQLPLPVKTGPEPASNSIATQDTAGDGERNSAKEQTLCAEGGKGILSQPPLPSHQAVHRELKSYRCTDCGKIYFSKKRFRRHQKARHQIKSYDKFYFSKSQLDRHQKLRHPLKSYDCTDQELPFYPQACLPREKHHERKPYKCTECGKSYKLKARFDYHQSTHTGVKAFECSECGMRFNRKGPLVQHFGIRHSTTPPPDTASARNKALGEKKATERPEGKRRLNDEKAIGCAKCEEHFVSRCELIVHRVKVHGKNQALRVRLKDIRRQVYEALESVASWQWSLVTDENAQDEENTQTCRTCRKNFNIYASFKEHLKSHRHGRKCCLIITQNSGTLLQ